MKPTIFPKTRQAGNVRVTIYKNDSPNRKGGVDYKVSFYDVDGKRRFNCFATLEKAEARAKEICECAQRGEMALLNLTKADHLTFTRAVKALQKIGTPLDIAAIEYAEARNALPAGVSLAEAVNFYVKHHQKAIVSKPVADVVTEFIERKTQAGLSKSYLSDLKHRCGKFAEAFVMDFDKLTPELVEMFFDSLKLSARSHNNFLRTLSILFQWAKTRNHIAENADLTARIHVRKDKGGKTEIFTPAEMTKLLSSAPADLIPVFVLGGFTGLRTSEILRLTWEKVDLESRFVKLDAKDTKTATRRVVKIPDNAVAWLRACHRKGNMVWPHSQPYLYEIIEKHCSAIGMEWKANALRHSAASYMVASTKNVPAVAYELGNSPRMVDRHYRELVTEADAKAWFAITPPKPASNVIQLAQAQGE